MNTLAVKQSLHQIIDQIEDNELLLICQQLLERELKKASVTDYSSKNEDEMIIRAKASLLSIEKGNTRSIEDFKNEIQNWKEKRAI
jgi:hypothetical protein